MAGPLIPGLPVLAASIVGNFAENLSLMVGDTFSLTGPALAPQWGIYQGGAPVIVSDTVLSLEFRKDWVVGDYPIERGSFESYDKVEMPFSSRIRFAAGGSPSAREALLRSIKAIVGNTQQYDIFTPDDVYTSATLNHMDYHRAAENGVSLLIVDVWVYEVRVAAGSAQTNTQQPSGADPSAVNNAQTTTAPQSTFDAGITGFASSSAIDYTNPNPGATIINPVQPFSI